MVTLKVAKKNIWPLCAYKSRINQGENAFNAQELLLLLTGGMSFLLITHKITPSKLPLRAHPGLFLS